MIRLLKNLIESKESKRKKREIKFEHDGDKPIKKIICHNLQTVTKLAKKGAKKFASLSKKGR